MVSLTRESAKLRCRTCLISLSTNQHSNKSEAGDLQETKKNISFDVNSNADLKMWMDKLLYNIEVGDYITYDEQYPHSICLECFNKLQSFNKFRVKAADSADKLKQLFCFGSNITKVELDEFENEFENENTLKDITNKYKLLIKDGLMETESIQIDTNTAELDSDECLTDHDPFDSTPKSGRVKKRRIRRKQSKKSSTLEQPNNEPAISSDDEVLSKKVAKTLKDNGKPPSTDKTNQKDSEGEDSNSELSLEKNAKAKKSNTRRKRRSKEEMEAYRKYQEQIIKRPPRRVKGLKNTQKCQKCKRSFAHKITLDAHVRKVHEGQKQPFQCDRCDKAYTFVGGLYTHIKEFHDRDGRRFDCDHPDCDRVYTSLITLQRHKRLKHSDMPPETTYVCEHCGATFHQSPNLKYHMKTRHPTDEQLAAKTKPKERFECDVCKKLFHSRYTLKYHKLQLHSNDMKYECKVCGRRMAKKFMLVQHMLVHSDDAEKMPCEVCGKKFIRKFELDSHVKAVHMKLKPFECQYCFECFASRKTLRHHEYIHTGEKPYVCDICGQAFRQQTCLKNHRKTHQKIRNNESGFTNDGYLSRNFFDSAVN